MNKTTFVLITSLILLNIKGLALDKKTNEPNCSFQENKGQVSDQFFNPRPDVLFSGCAKGMVYHLRNNGISYQLNRIDSWKEEIDPSEITGAGKVNGKKVPDQTTIYRLDVNWLNCNSNTLVKKGEAQPGYNSYYLQSCPEGVLNVKSYSDVTYQNIYNGIDLKWYEKNGQLKYDYLVSAGANYKNIQLEFKGATKISLNTKGELILKTPLGTIIEQAPLVTQNGKILPSKWIIKNNIVSFDIKNINPSSPFVIDPALRIWGTYYGGTGDDEGYSCTTDASGNVYLAGATNSSNGTVIATVGGHQTVYVASYDAFLAKFNSAGVRQWGTYYGGNGVDIAYACTADALGNVYISGYSGFATGTVIATVGSHQSTLGGGAYDAMLVKFNSAGTRQWGTYYGGTGGDYSYSCSTDASGNVYMAGITNSGGVNTIIATAGSHQSSNGGGTSDAFLVKFNGAGVRQWGTYYGGGNTDYGYGCATDISGNVYMAGKTNSSGGTVIATPGSHQSVYGGNPQDGFLAKFNSSGVRQWGTYYGGTGDDEGRSCITDASGNVYLAGITSSSVGTVIATAGSHQTINNGGADAFLVQFNTAGVRQWGTYYGGTGITDNGLYCNSDASGNVYLSGITNSSGGTVIATASSHQNTFGGGTNDAFLVQFNNSGIRQSGTYYGGTGIDYGNSCAIDASGNVYFAGYTGSTTGTVIASAGSHQNTYGGGPTESFLVKFNGCGSAPSQPSSISGNVSICSGSSNTYSIAVVGGATSYTWTLPGGWTGTSTTNIITTTASATVGIISVIAGNNCGSSPSQTLSVTVNSIPSIPGAIAGNIIICEFTNQTYSITPVAGATSYSWSTPGGFVGTSTTNVLTTTAGVNSGNIIVTASNACGTSPSQTLAVQVNNAPLTPGAINGLNNICSGAGSTTYSIATVVGATSYTWSLPGGWSGSSATNTISATPGSTGIFTVTASNICGTSPQQTLNVTVNALPSISVNSGSICNGQSFTMTPNGASTYTFQGGSAVVSPTTNTSYTVIGTSSAGCTSSVSATSNVTVNPLPNIAASSSTNQLCIGSSATLAASGGSSYTWNPGGAGTTIVISPTVNTTYTLNGTDANGCSNSTVITQAVINCSPSALSELKTTNNEIVIYPNPSSEILNVELDPDRYRELNGNSRIQLFNVISELVMDEPITTQHSTFNIQHFPSGIYFLRIGSVTKKLIKQ